MCGDVMTYQVRAQHGGVSPYVGLDVLFLSILLVQISTQRVERESVVFV